MQGVSDQLILIVSYRCNLRCAHCPVAKSNKTLSADTAKKAVSSFLKISASPGLRVKFAGAEPFVNFRAIKETVRFSKLKNKNPSFSVATNGALIDKRIFAYLKKHAEIEVWYSPHPAARQQKGLALSELPNIGINILISPRTVARLTEDFLGYIRRGYRKFNFLPAYFTPWQNTAIRMLEREFRALAVIIKNLTKKGGAIQVKNLTSMSSTPLFNDGFVVDCNGDIFQNNLILSRVFSHLKAGLRIGHVARPEEIQWRRGLDHASLLKDALSEQAYGSTLAVDQALSGFVASLRQAN